MLSSDLVCSINFPTVLNSQGPKVFCPVAQDFFSRMQNNSVTLRRCASCRRTLLQYQSKK